MAPNCRQYCKNQLFLPLLKRCTLLFCRFRTRSKCSFGSASQLKVFLKIHLIVPFVCEYNAAPLRMLSSFSISSITLLFSSFPYISRRIWTAILTYYFFCHHLHSAFHSAVHFNTRLLNLSVAWVFRLINQKQYLVFNPRKA